MIERLIENWLISAGERGYETSFAQLLSAEKHQILQAPVHHPFEHGKDILTISPSGELHAYQLKGPNLTNLEDFEKIQEQLFALAAAAVTHPSISPPRRADRVFLVTNSVLTPPVRDRIDKFNAANLAYGLPQIETIERHQLLSRFLDAHGKYLPQRLEDVRTLLVRTEYAAILNDCGELLSSKGRKEIRSCLRLGARGRDGEGKGDCEASGLGRV